MICLFGHKWNGCKCERCGKTRDENHIWNGCKCTVCGKVRNEGHEFRPVAGKCMEKCAICGKTREVEHEWDGCVCTRCGAVRHELEVKGGKVIVQNGTIYIKGKCKNCKKEILQPLNSVPAKALGQCSAYRNGRCAPYGKDSGYSCSWRPGNWTSCNVYIENMKYYHYWDL